MKHAVISQQKSLDENTKSMTDIDHFRNSEIYELLRFPDSDRNPADLSLAAERDDEENYD